MIREKMEPVAQSSSGENGSLEETEDRRNSFRRESLNQTVDRRVAPRYALGEKALWISTLPDFKVKDISSFGVGLGSTYPVKRGQVVRLSRREGPTVDAMVTRCRLLGPPVGGLEADFQVGCKFIARNEGLRFFQAMR